MFQNLQLLYLAEYVHCDKLRSKLSELDLHIGALGPEKNCPATANPYPEVKKLLAKTNYFQARKSPHKLYFTLKKQFKTNLVERMRVIYTHFTIPITYNLV